MAAEAGAFRVPQALNNTETATARLHKELTTFDRMGLRVPLMPPMYQKNKSIFKKGTFSLAFFS